MNAFQFFMFFIALLCLVCAVERITKTEWVCTNYTGNTCTQWSAKE